MSDPFENPGNGAGVIRKTVMHNAGTVFAAQQTITPLPKTPNAIETTIPFRDSSLFQLTGDTQ